MSSLHGDTSVLHPIWANKAVFTTRKKDVMISRWPKSQPKYRLIKPEVGYKRRNVKSDTHTLTYSHIHSHTHTYTHTLTHTYKYTHTHIQIHTHTYKYTHTHIHSHTHTHTLTPGRTPPNE